MDGPL